MGANLGETKRLANSFRVAQMHYLQGPVLVFLEQVFGAQSQVTLARPRLCTKIRGAGTGEDQEDLGIEASRKRDLVREFGSSARARKPAWSEKPVFDCTCLQTGNHRKVNPLLTLKTCGFLRVTFLQREREPPSVSRSWSAESPFLHRPFCCPNPSTSGPPVSQHASQLPRKL